MFHKYLKNQRSKLIEIFWLFSHKPFQHLFVRILHERKYCPSSTLHEESKEQQNVKLYSQNVMKMTKAK